MPANNTYRHYNLKQAKRNTLNVNTFGGVDYSGQKFQISSSHALDSVNYVYKDGLVRKRQGYSEKAYVPTFKYIAYDDTSVPHQIKETTSKRFNGIWHFLAEDGQYHTIAHIGKVLFEIKNINEKIVSFELLTSLGNATGTDSQSYPVVFEHLDQKSMAFVGANRLWFLGGNKYMIIGFRTDGRIIYEPVEESEYTYVPTTSIGITYANSIVSGRSGFDYANNLTMWRQNVCLSGTGKNEEDIRRTKFYEYTLDAPIKTKDTNADVEALKNNKSLSSISLETQRALAKIKIRIEKLKTEEE